MGNYNKKFLLTTLLSVLLMVGFLISARPVNAASLVGSTCPKDGACYDVVTCDAQCGQPCTSICFRNPITTVKEEAEDIAAGVLSIPLSAATLIWYVLMYVLQMALTAILYVASFLLDNALLYNIVLNPTNMPAVVNGWVIVRNIANALFLLVILWVAIKTIFSFDEGANKQLLVRIIIYAFLINFSLALTGASFGLANALAKPFRDAIGPDVAGFIINATKISTMTLTPSTDGTAKYIQAIDQKNCGLASLLDPKTRDALGENCQPPRMAEGFVTTMTSVVNLATEKSAKFKETVALTIANFFLILVLIMFWLMVFLLSARVIAMAFLGVLAPAAFFLKVFPIPSISKMFDEWLDNLLKWSFMAPVFYFLFYLSLVILKTMVDTPALKLSGVPFASNLLAMVPLIIFLAFLAETMHLTKKMGGKGAQMAIDIGKKVGGLAIAGGMAVATGGTSLAASGAARVAQPVAEKAMAGLAERPILGKITAPITNLGRAHYAAKDQEIDKMRGEYSKMPPRLLTQQLKATLSPDKKIAMGEALHQQGEFDKLDADTQLKVMGHAERRGRDYLLKARPDQATKATVPDAKDDRDAKKKIFSKMTSQEKAAVSKYALNDEVKAVMLETSNKEDIQAIMRYNFDLMKELIYGFFNQHQQQLQSTMKAETYNSIIANMRLHTAKPQKQATPPTP